jgi:hypothetical protein
MGKKILYSVVVFGLIGLGIYVTSTFEYHQFITECELESNSKGGVEACVEYKVQEAQR